MTTTKEATSTASLQKLFLRLSNRDRLLILAGLNRLVKNYELRSSGGGSVNVARVWSARFDPGVYSQSMMGDLLAVRERLLQLKNYGRLRFDNSFQIAACALAVRIAMKSHRHGHPSPQIPRIETAAKRLLNRLEVARKRAKRAELRQMGADAYQEKAQEWRRFVVWVRLHIANCGCVPRRKITSGRNRLIITTLANWTREELEDRKVQVPEEAELRRFVRLKLRYVRRGRASYGVRDLLSNKVLAASQLATFVTIQLEKSSTRRKA